MLKPIETKYKGHRFRSRLEARWAVFMDAAGIPYQYEPEGFVLDDGTYYLPDFYLPDQKAFLEVKGVMDDDSKHKIDEFIKSRNSDEEFIIGYDGLRFTTAYKVGDIDGEVYVEECNESWLCRCNKCGKLYFMPSWFSWACRCCGYYDGDRTMTVLCEGDQPYYYEPTKIAMQARFEHGENG